MDYKEVEAIATRLLALGRAAVAEYEAGALQNETLLELCRDLVEDGLPQPSDEVMAVSPSAESNPQVAAADPDEFTPHIVVDPVDPDDITAPEPAVLVTDDDVEPEVAIDPLIVAFDDDEAMVDPVVEPDVEIAPLVVDVDEEVAVNSAMDEVFPVVDSADPNDGVPHSQPAFDPFQVYDSEPDASPVADLTPVDEPEAPEVCPQCHANLRPGMRFCTTCGLKVGDSPTTPPPIVSAPPTKQCNTCYATLPADAVFCTSCGTSITQPPPIAPPTQPSVTPVAPPSNDKFCDTCGLGVAVEVVTCPSCQGSQFS